MKVKDIDELHSLKGEARILADNELLESIKTRRALMKKEKKLNYGRK